MTKNRDGIRNHDKRAKIYEIIRTKLRTKFRTEIRIQIGQNGNLKGIEYYHITDILGECKKNKNS